MKGDLIDLLCLTAHLEKMPTEAQMLQVCRKSALNLLQVWCKSEATTLEKILKKVLEDVKKVNHKKDVSRETSERYRNSQQNSDTSRDTSLDTSDDAIEKRREDKIYTYVEMWNDFSKKKKLSQVKEATTERKARLKTRIKNGLSIDKFCSILSAAEKQTFLFGDDGGWKMTFDWLIKNDLNYVKILENSYGREKQNKGLEQHYADL